MADVRPLSVRARDYALVAAALGGTFQATHAARHDAPILISAARTSFIFGAAAASFIGLRHAMLKGQWEDDREGISGMAAGIVGGTIATLGWGPRFGSTAGAGCLVAGAALHYVHRWWLHGRLWLQLSQEIEEQHRKQRKG
jgi:hypothetical protein